MKWYFIAIMILSALILILVCVLIFTIFGFQNKILKLELQLQNTENNKIEEIKKYELENEEIKKVHNQLVYELQKATSLKDYIEITKKINTELGRL